MKPLVLRTLLLTCGLAMVCLSMAGEPATPAFVTSENICSILMGGGGMVFASDEQNNQWFIVNRTVSKAAAESLQSMGYRIDPFIVDIRDNAQRLKALGEEVTHKQCNRIIQISHGMSGQSDTNPGVAKSFQFDVSVLSISADRKFASQYQKTYSYPLTKEVMETLSMGEVGKTIAADIDKAHVINKAPPPSGRASQADDAPHG